LGTVHIPHISPLVLHCIDALTEFLVAVPDSEGAAPDTQEGVATEALLIVV